MIVDVSGEHNEIEWLAQCRVSWRPGRYSGPPEDCYPDEGEVEILYLATNPPGREQELDEEAIEEAAWKAFEERSVDDV